MNDNGVPAVKGNGVGVYADVEEKTIKKLDKLQTELCDEVAKISATEETIKEINEKIKSSTLYKELQRLKRERKTAKKNVNDLNCRRLGALDMAIEQGVVNANILKRMRVEQIPSEN